MASSHPSPALVELILARLSLEEHQKTIQGLIEDLNTSDPTGVDLASLQLCIQLLHAAKDTSQFENLSEIILRELERETVGPARLAEIAEICVNDHELSTRLLRRVDILLLHTVHIISSGEDTEFVVPTKDFLERYLPETITRDDEPPATEFVKASIKRSTHHVNFLKHYFWKFRDESHAISAGLATSLIALLGGESDLANSSNAALSALLPLLGKGMVNVEKDVMSNDALWERFGNLLHSPSRFGSAGTTFKLWFQWVCQSGQVGPTQYQLQNDRYWAMLQSGLFAGFAEQRKFCLGIIQKSLIILQQDVATEHMTFVYNRKHEYGRQYEKYSTLFETVVLDRYPNQVQACLSDLTDMMASDSLVHTSWMTTLLSAALNHRVQDGVRKIVGNWYMGFCKDECFSLADQQNFLLHGFLPWATQGSLFTSTLVDRRQNTTCAHGDNLTKVIQRFVQSIPDIIQRRVLLRSMLGFVQGTRGNIFPYAIPYLLEGLLDGFRNTDSLEALEVTDLGLVVETSLRTGLPEIARDLCTAYCNAFFLNISTEARLAVPGYGDLKSRWEELIATEATERSYSPVEVREDNSEGPQLSSLVKALEASRYRILQGKGLSEACDFVLRCLDSTEANDISPDELYQTLEAIWEEVDTQEYPRAATMKLPAIILHPQMMQLRSTTPHAGLDIVVPKALQQLSRLAEGRIYVFSPLSRAIRKACLQNPRAYIALNVEDFLVRFLGHTALPKNEFLFEPAAASKLQAYVPHRTYASYYGKREWYGYACVIDLLNRFPNEQRNIAISILGRLLRPWLSQELPVLIISKWKEPLQLQAILVLLQQCVIDIGVQVPQHVDHYLNLFMDILALEPWPRYRHLLAWIVARIYLDNPGHSYRLIEHLKKERDPNPKLIASLLKIAVMVAGFPNTPHDFTLQLMTALVPFSAHPKIQIRHEAHRSFPMVWNVAVARGWLDILENPPFAALNEHLCSLDKFKDAEYSGRMFNLDLTKDHNLVNIFQGDYLRADPLDRELVAYEDFQELWAEDERDNFTPPPARIPLGEPKTSRPVVTTSNSTTAPAGAEEPASSAASSIPLQTKSSSWESSLLSQLQPTSLTSSRPTTLILVGSLIDNPHNLGGLSRVSEIFGLEALAIRSLDTTSHKDFLAVSVTSHKHLPIISVPPSTLPPWLLEKKREGYSVVCVEQTDRSLVLGEVEEDGKGGKVLPEKCVLVLGSEKEGVSAEVLEVADRCVEIRQWGVTRSLNVQTAGAIACFEWQRLWGKKGGV